MWLVLGGVGLMVAAGGLLWSAGRSQRRRQALLATETLTCRDLSSVLDAVARGVGDSSMGRVVEVCGQARPGRVALRSPLAGRDCVWYRSVIIEHSREYEQRGTGNDRRRELVTKQREVSDETSSDPVVIDDGTGTITVAVDGAKVDSPQQVMDRHVKDDDGWAGRFAISLASIVGGGEGVTGYQHREWIIAPDTQLFAIGEAHKEGSALRMLRPVDGEKPFIVSTRKEEDLKKSAALAATLQNVGAGVAAVAGIGLIIAGSLG